MRLALVFAAVWLTPAMASAFQILTPATRPCHERITLGAADALDPPFGSPNDAQLESLLAALDARAEVIGLPRDDGTRAMIEDVAETYGFDDEPSKLRRFVLASLVLGVREPDTRGLAVIRFNESRTVHIDDDNQAAHSLRRSFDDGLEGDAAAIANARAELLGRLDEAHSEWHREPRTLRSAVWSFPFYGEVVVKVLPTAFHLGEMVHTVQDAYTHTLRDDALRVVSVLNFVEAVLGRHRETRDGLQHSDRLDECNLGSDDFDVLRFEAARRATAAALAGAEVVLSAATYDPGPVDAVLDEVYAHREGCSPANDYCGSDWVEPARESLTEPIRAWFCAAAPGEGPPAWWILSLLAFGIRRRARRAPSPPASWDRSA